MSTTAQIIHFVISASVLWFCLLPFCIMWVNRIYRVRKALFMRKRYIDGSLYCCIAAILWLFVDRPISLMESYLVISGYTHEDTWFFFYALLPQFMYPFFSQGIVYALVYRFWMIYFDFIYSESLEQQQWKVQINPKGSSQNEAWIIQHRRDYGNANWIFKRLALVYVIVASFTTTLRVVAYCGAIPWSIAHPIDSALYFIPLMIAFVVWCKMPTFADSFMVKDELKWIIVICVAGLFANVVLVALFIVITDMNEYWQSTVYFYPVLLICLSLIFVQTQYILIRVRRDASYFRNILAEHEMYDESHTEPSQSGVPAINPNIYRIHSLSSQSPTQPAGNRSKHKLCDVLQDKITFNLFVHHISTELSTECIFSFIEFTQFQMLLQSDEAFMQTLAQYTANSEHERNTEDKTVVRDRLCAFEPRYKMKSKDSYNKVKLLDSEVIPLSHIVFGREYREATTKLQRYKRVVIALAQKYIYDSGDFCININYNTRLDIMEWIHVYCCDEEKQFELKQYCEIYHLFEKCRKEMYKLMQHTLSRFIRTNQFLALNKQ